MIHLIYISSATRFPSEQALTELLEQSRARNLKQNITGMLLYDNATYLQVLEGEADDVHEIFAAIRKDARNTGVVKLLEEAIDSRDFAGWSMGFRNLEGCKPEDLPGFVDIYNGRLDKNIAIHNESSAIRLLMNFAARATK